MAMDEQQRQLDVRAQQIGEAARKVEAMTLSLKTGISEQDLLDAGPTLADMRQKAIDGLAASNAAELAALINPAPIADPDDPATPPAPGTAPGAAAAPTTTDPSVGGTSPLGSDPIKEILDRPDIGKGSGDMEGFMEAYRSTVGFEDVSLTTGQVVPAAPAAPVAPAPAATPAPAAAPTE
jgi:hypothetical protein